MSTLRITQVKSANGTDQRQRDTLRSLGLRRIGQTVERPDSPQLRGMVHAVRHLVVVEEKSSEPSASPTRSRAETIGLHNLKPAPGSRKDRKRVGRGHGSGHGKTSGRGHKGYGSRAGAKDRARFEGGQNPIHMRMRKLRGPNKKMSMPFEMFRTHTQPVNLDDLEARFDEGASVDARRAARRRPGDPQGHPGQGARPRRAHEAADRPRPRLLQVRPREDRGRGRHLPDHRVVSARRARRALHDPELFKVPEIRKKLAFTAAMLALYRLGSLHPGAGRQHSTALKQIEDNYAGSNILGFLNLFTGGGLSRLALFALGIMPYITASIILQLLTVVSPSLEKLSKEGEVGQAKITQYTRYLTVGLAAAQAVGYVFLFRSQGNSAGTPVFDDFSLASVILIVVCLTAGCVLLMWFGELITQRGIGNGISLMIFASIVSRLPQVCRRGGQTPTRSSR